MCHKQQCDHTSREHRRKQNRCYVTLWENGLKTHSVIHSRFCWWASPLTRKVTFCMLWTGLIDHFYHMNPYKCLFHCKTLLWLSVLLGKQHLGKECCPNIQHMNALHRESSFFSPLPSWTRCSFSPRQRLIYMPEHSIMFYSWSGVFYGFCWIFMDWLVL